MTNGNPVTRHIRHPGPANEIRLRSLSAGGRSGTIRLQAGAVLMDAIAAHLEPLEIRSAALDLSSLVLGPMQFVMPTYSRSPEHVAYYSETRFRDGPVTIEVGTATYGSRDGRPFLHGHVLWQDADGTGKGGHILPMDCRIGGDCEIAFVGCREIAMDARFDPETNFTLFGPHHMNPDSSSSGDLIVAQIRPNEDLVRSLERICTDHNVRSGRIMSLIGSTVGARFEDGLSIDEVPTEILGLTGTFEIGKTGQPYLDIEIALIDAAGNIHRGRPKRDENLVLICVEVFIQSQD
ncbi:PCC domain-containing protein [Aquamicrobium segne]|uniref:PCC domain-containing protein n=1 Tax=Aquamicrobium segne TaxID=469547 RepID=A0ABW0H2P1_9HYPH